MARNGYTDLLRLRRFAGLAGRDVGTYPALDDAEASRLAAVLRLPDEVVVHRLHRVVERADVAGDRIDFFGVPLRAAYREWRWRRTSPRALALAPYHRAIHDLRPFGFCTQTLETLIDACPVCHRRFGWHVTRGIAFCPRCVDEDDYPTVDLRDHPQPLVELEDPAGALLLATLVDPRPDVRAEAMRRVDPALRHETPGDLFELAISVALAMVTPPDADKNAVRSVRGDGAITFEPARLAQVGRMLIEWRSGFSVAADLMRATAPARDMRFGVHKEIGALRLLRTRRTLAPGIRTLVADAIRHDMRRTAEKPAAPRRKADRDEGLVDARQAAAILGVGGKTVRRLAKRGAIDVVRSGDRAMVLMRRDEVEALRQEHADMVDGPSAARAVGLPLEALEALADTGAITRATGPALGLVAARVHFRRSSLDAYVARVIAGARDGGSTVTYRPFGTAIRRLPPGDRPWLAILAAIGDGRLPCRPCAAAGPALLRLSVDEAALARVAGLGEAGGDGAVTVAYREAAILLGVPEPTVSWIVAAGLLATTGDHDRRLTRDAIRRFNAEYALTAEVARSLGVPPPRLKQVLAARGIQPVAALHKGMRLVWRRGEVLG
ncbi:hypothetical protein MOTC310_29385 [Methylobacterium oryzae]|uniref:Helix-turn-helix domain-containing protein n=2 Tax=Methylobacterium oryzae TaxID=334852 RepID=A0ABU7TXD0_9HYPH